MGAGMIMNRFFSSFIAGAALLCIPGHAIAGQVPNPVNAPASVGSGNLLSASGTNPQQAADSGISATTAAINKVVAGPSSGGAGALTLRSLVAADIPSLSVLGAQPTLTSGTNIKTVGGVSLLGSGDLGAINAPALNAIGTKPTLTGTCTTSTQVGGNNAGTFKATCAAQTVIMTFSTAATNGYVCIATDETTVGDTLKQTATTTNSCTLFGTTVAADVVGFIAIGY